MEKATIHRKFDLQLTALSPIAINTGEQLSPMSDYFVLKDKLHYIDEDKLQHLLQENEPVMQRYESMITETKIDDAKNFLKRLIDNDEQLRSLSNGITVPYSGSKTFLLNTVVKQGGQPYIPGSSIKGAIKNAYLYYWLTKLDKHEHLERFLAEHRTTFKAKAKIITECSRKLSGMRDHNAKRDISNKIKREQKACEQLITNFSLSIQKEAFCITHNSAAGESLLRQPTSNLLISDSTLLPVGQLCVANIKRKSLAVQVKDWELSCQEYLPPLSTCYFNIQINASPNDWKEQNTQSGLGKILHSTSINLSELFHILNTYHKALVASKMKFNLQLPSSAVDINEAILHLGTGKGIYENTVLLAMKHIYDEKDWDFKSEFIPLFYEDADHYEDFPNSVAHIHEQPMGWVKLTDVNSKSYEASLEQSYTEVELRSGAGIEAIFKAEGKPQSFVTILIEGQKQDYAVSGTKNFLRINPGALKPGSKCIVYWRNGALNFNP